VTTKAMTLIPIKEASLLYTTNIGEWQQRKWEAIPAEVKGDTISAHLPSQRPLTWYLLVTDEQGIRVSTEHEEWVSDNQSTRSK
jgi:hypothetical protein